MINLMAKAELDNALSKGDLLSRCAAGERSAREELAAACLPRVRRTVILTMGGGQDTDDLVQTAMARVFAGLGGFRGEAGFVTWLDTVTVNTVRQYYRRRPLNLLFCSSSEPPDACASPVESPDRKLEGQRMLERLAAHLKSIRPNKRVALVLSAAYGYSAREVAELMGCTAETAKKRLQHGRRDLLSRLRKDGYLSQVLKETES